MNQSPQPAIVVIFGITGDLAQRKLLPALYHLMKDNLLDERTVILGVSRKAVSVDALLGQVELCVNEIDKICDPAAIAKVRSSLRMIQMSYTEAAEYQALHIMLNALEDEAGVCMNRLYYLSIPPQMFTPIVRNLGEHQLNQSCQHGKAATRLLVEKPFGYDVASAAELITETSKWFTEQQLFRIDHYLAKETVQNIVAFRMFNPIFTELWNRDHIASIDITAFEKIDIEGRAEFYEAVGALRDFIQSHLLQLLAVVTMDLPKDLTSQSVHAAKSKLMASIKPIQPADVTRAAVRGQYQGYRHEVDNPDTATETYAAIKVTIDTDVWRGVPMTLRTGKALSEKRTDVKVRFKGHAHQTGTYNDLLFRIQPTEGISLNLSAKKPGFIDSLEQVVMDFNYQYSFDAQGHPDAYERVLVDAARGDHTLFTTSQEVMSAWEIVEHVQNAWKTSAEGLVIYPKGSDEVHAISPAD